jgi:hypothetical protein
MVHVPPFTAQTGGVVAIGGAIKIRAGAMKLYHYLITFFPHFPFRVLFRTR